MTPHYILGTAVIISQQEQNVTTGPTAITVAAVVYDRIVINIPDAFVSVVAEIEARIEEQRTMPDSTPIITFMALINSHGEQQAITIPQEDVSAIEKGTTYFVEVRSCNKCQGYHYSII